MQLEKDGKSIVTVEDWHELAPPKSAHQWVKGRSAYELAHAWCGSGEPAMPEALRLLLESREETRGFVPDVARPEHRIPFDAFGGEPRNADLALTGSNALGRIAITIEAKADEPFGETVSAALAVALERGIENPRSNGVRRIEGLARALFRAKEKGQPRVAEVYPPEGHEASSFLAVRWVGDSRRVVRGRGGLSEIVEPAVPASGRPDRRSARRVGGCRVDAHGGPRWTTRPGFVAAVGFW